MNWYANKIDLYQIILIWISTRFAIHSNENINNKKNKFSFEWIYRFKFMDKKIGVNSEYHE